jgi:uncharacterized protein (DUF488 family)
MVIHTIGHSTHPIEEFIDILKTHNIRLPADIRTIPKSRHNPQYNSDALAAGLREHGIGYEHMPSIGGLRHAKKDSVNMAWENASFRGFADYMQTEGFERGLGRLIELAKQDPTVIMCAEAVPWRCHRSLIGDALLARGVMVMDIMSKSSAIKHKLTAFAEMRGLTVTYPKK